MSMFVWFQYSSAISTRKMVDSISFLYEYARVLNNFQISFYFC